ncbi:MAG: mannose-1-phosphate guanylyltransferase [Pirellulales bacterium]
MLHALIMAGGSGTRFWPESRRARPKQLLPLADDRTMLRATVDRLDGIVPPERTWLAVGTSLVPAIREQLPEIADRQYVAEPCQRNTAPCIGLAALRMLADDPEAGMLVLPSDHAIRDVAAFQKAVKLAAALADKPRKQIVTFGIKPTYPSEGFGYIERGETLSPPQGAFKALAAELDAYSVVRFREKPKLEQAKEFLEAGTFYWNSGMFVWRADVIVDALRTHQPELLKHLETIAAAHGTPEYEAVLDREFRAAPSISIDYAVMEHAKSIIVIEVAVRLGRRRRLAQLGAASRHGRRRQYDRRQTPGARHQRHDRSHQRRSPCRHARPQKLPRRPHARRHARRRQERRRVDSQARQNARRTRLDRRALSPPGVKAAKSPKKPITTPFCPPSIILRA